MNHHGVLEELLTNEKEKGTTRCLESSNGRRMYSLPSLNIIRVGSVLDVTDDTILYFSASFGDLATSTFPNLKVLLAYLDGVEMEIISCNLGLKAL